MGTATRKLFDGLTIPVLGLTTWDLPAVSVSEWLFRVVVMLSVVVVAFLLGDWGFKTLEQADRRQFFERAAYRLAPISKMAIAAGWLGVLVSLPIGSALLDLPPTELRFHFVWPILVASVASALILWKMGKPVGTSEGWALHLLDVGEELLRRPVEADRESLEAAQNAFKASHAILQDSRNPAAERAAHGLAEVQKRLSQSGSGPRA
jgi:hypothetical protein